MKAIVTDRLTKKFGAFTAVDAISFDVDQGEIFGFLGANGAGKTSIFRNIVGEEGYDSGTVSKPESWVVGYFSQDVGEMKGRSALEEVMAGAGRVSALAEELHQIEKRLGALAEDPGDGSEMEKVLERFGEVQLEFESRGGYDLEARAKEILTGLGIGPEDHGKRVEAFSGGWKMRIALAKILVLQPDVLLAD